MDRSAPSESAGDGSPANWGYSVQAAMYGGDDHGGTSERSHVSCVSEEELHPPYERDAVDSEQQEAPRLGIYRVDAGVTSPASQASRLPVRDIDEPELVPDYSALPAEDSGSCKP